jgi:ketosteroid isomerase-like protein
MPDENVLVVRRFIRRFVEPGSDELLEDVHPEATLDWSDSDAPDSGIYTGHEAWRAFARARDEVLAGRVFEFGELIPVEPDRVVLTGVMRERGRTSGVQVEAQGAAVFTLSEGKITRMKLYQRSAEAFAAVGLAR